MSTPLPPVPGVLKAILKFTATSAPGAQSHLYMHTTTSMVTNAQMTALATLIRTNWSTYLKASMSVQWSLSQVIVEDLGPTPDISGIDTTVVTGTIAGTPLPAETAFLINIAIGRRYKGGHPRLYLPMGAGASIVDLTHWQTTFVAGMQTAWLNLTTAILAGGAGTPTIDKFVTVSYYTGKTLRPTPQVDNVLTFAVNPVPGSQRRRMGR